jgi:hypothetical protein
MASPAFSEAQLHKAAAQFLDLALPSDAVWTTFPAGGGGKARGGILKAMGLRAGWPDIQILWRDHLYCIELKSAKGNLSPDQRALHERIVFCGGVVVTCRSLHDIYLALQIFGIPCRAHVTESGAVVMKRAA